MPSFFRRKRNSKEGSKPSSNENDSTTTYKVKIPPNTNPGDEFQIYAGNQKLKIKCPAGTRPGQSLAITVPDEKQDINKMNERNGANVKYIPGSDPPAYMVTIPPKTRGGTKFAVMINGTNLMVTSPENALPGMNLRIVPPAESRTTHRKRNIGQKFEVQIPSHVNPGESFALLANGIRVLVECPMNANAGQMVRFNLPFRTAGNFVKKLEYDVDGWARTLQVAQMKFQWARVSKRQVVHSNSIAKRMNQNAYVRHLSKHGLELIPAQCELVHSTVVSKSGKELASCSDLIEMQTMSLDEKTTAFHGICRMLGKENNDGIGHLYIKVRREHLLLDSMQAILVLNCDEMKKRWRIHFIGEEGIDAGGLKREFFQLISDELFDLDSGLWMTCGENQMSLQVHPSSELLNEDHLLYFRFLGRIMGKALFDGELISGHLVKTLYKHMLGWPVTFSDLEYLDPRYYQSIKALMDMDDVEYACLDFTISEDVMGIHKTVELIPNGANIEVTNENIVQYLEAVLEYRLIGRVRFQQKEMLLGFMDVIPVSLLTIFDFQELELLLCGFPHIDIEDWMDNTLYSGQFKNMKDQVIAWWWEVVGDFEEEKKARLLQFVTGTSGVPPKGFGALQGNEGGIKKFTIHGVSLESCYYPRAHTCFNRIDLPVFESREQLRDRLEVAITMVATGFDLE